MWNIENPLYQKDISPAFLEKVEYVRKRIFDNCAPKKGFTGGSVVSGFRMFAALPVIVYYKGCMGYRFQLRLNIACSMDFSMELLWTHEM